ncbi:MAG: hypothetical protein LJE56_08405 [Acidiferrobacterales bacterium]|jgi:hypothetical protein|nr:hypothetical protein [Acidiferrobacterales bacterium]
MKTLTTILASALIVFSIPLHAADKKEKVVEIGGMSIIGNRELPKTLYIVPWKDSDIDSETDLSRDLLNERLKVVDQEEFGRQLKYYELSK